MPGKRRGVSRRDFVASAVAIGGPAALSACVSREQSVTETATGTPTSEGGGAQFPKGADPSSLPRGQHVWNEYLVHNPHGNTKLPRHHLILGLDYVGSMPPTSAEREQVQTAMASLDRAIQWGTGGKASAAINLGLLTMLGYSSSYLSEVGFDVDGFRPATDVLEAVGEDPSKADSFEAQLVLNSDLGSTVLAAEAALTGERDALNGRTMDATFEGVFEVATRRSGVVGRGNPAEELDNENIPEEAPLSMGFLSGFRDNQATEQRVTFQSGPFAGGTTLQSSRLHIDLPSWYDNGPEERVDLMLTPDMDVEDAGITGDKLGTQSGVTEEDTESIQEDAAKYGRVGHSQKVARARDDDFEPRILRRTEGVITDGETGAGMNFNSVQRDIQAFVDTRTAMNVDEYDVDVEPPDHGIVDYLETEARGTYVVPPRDRRGLPVPQ